MGVFIRLVMVIGKKSTLNKGLGVFHVLKSSFMWSTAAKRNVFCLFRIIYHDYCHKSLCNIE